jgi:beta-lactam-binding protein with PASTA domain
VDEEADFFRPPAKSPVPAALVTSIITSVALFFGLRALDERGVFAAFSRPKSAVVDTPQVVEVPSLLGMRAEQAREILSGRELLLAFSSERDSAQYPAGAIVEQSPLAGSQVQKRSAIQAVLSRGLKHVAVPRVAGLKAEDAIKQLIDAGLTAGPQKIAPSESAPVGTVIESDPAIGAQVAAAGAVVLVVSSGASSKPLPKVTGLRLRAARELLEQQGFKVGKIRHDSDGDRSSGIVLEQRPPATTPAAPGSAVDLTVNED